MNKYKAILLTGILTISSSASILESSHKGESGGNTENGNGFCYLHLDQIDEEAINIPSTNNFC